VTAFDFVKNLGAGWNLGDTLDSVSERESNPATHEMQWGNPLTTQAMIDTVRTAGFQTLRVPVTWYQHTNADFVINEQFLSRVKEVVNYGLAAGMTVILNQHHENWTFPSDENFPAAKERLAKTWTQIANAFADAPRELIFEGMNEPRKMKTSVEWTGGDEEGRRVVMQLNSTFVDAVRATGANNTTRILLVPTYAASSEEVVMQDFSLPNDPNVAASLHAYIPYEFALKNDYDVNDWDETCEAAIDTLFERIQRLFIARKIPVIMGETAARAKRGNTAARAKWAAYYTAKAGEIGVPCCWWDNGNLNGPDETDSFGLLNRKTLAWEYPEIVNAFVGTKC